MSAKQCAECGKYMYYYYMCDMEADGIYHCEDCFINKHVCNREHPEDCAIFVAEPAN